MRGAILPVSTRPSPAGDAAKSGTDWDEAPGPTRSPRGVCPNIDEEPNARRHLAGFDAALTRWGRGEIRHGLG